jgi:hypothetical protein
VRWQSHFPETDKVVSPEYDETIRKLVEGKRDADGKFTADQLEEWFGDIDW